MDVVSKYVLCNTIQVLRHLFATQEPCTELNSYTIRFQAVHSNGSWKFLSGLLLSMDFDHLSYVLLSILWERIPVLLFFSKILAQELSYGIGYRNVDDLNSFYSHLSSLPSDSGFIWTRQPNYCFYLIFFVHQRSFQVSK